MDTSAGSAALQAVPRPIVAFVGRLHTDTRAENLQQHLTDMDIRGIRCTKLEAKDGRVFNTAAFRVSCDPAYKDLFYNEASWLWTTWLGILPQEVICDKRIVILVYPLSSSWLILA